MKINNLLEITNEDNINLMARYPDNYFDLAIVDPPYGLDFSNYNRVSTRTNGDKYISNIYKKGSWDNSIPNENYFIELIRVSKNQIVWGGNYFPYLWKKGCKGFFREISDNLLLAKGLDPFKSFASKNDYSL